MGRSDRHVIGGGDTGSDRIGRSRHMGRLDRGVIGGGDTRIGSDRPDLSQRDPDRIGSPNSASTRGRERERRRERRRERAREGARKRKSALTAAYRVC